MGSLPMLTCTFVYISSVLIVRAWLPETAPVNNTSGENSEAAKGRTSCIVEPTAISDATGNGWGPFLRFNWGACVSSFRPSSTYFRCWRGMDDFADRRNLFGGKSRTYVLRSLSIS